MRKTEEWYYSLIGLLALLLLLAGFPLVVAGTVFASLGYARLVLVGGLLSALGGALGVLDSEQERAHHEGRVGPLDRVRAVFTRRRAPP